MILVTGATSAVGKAVIKELLARKVLVRAFLRQPVDAAKLQAQGVEAFLGDMTKQASVAQALQGIESVYLITPVAEYLLETEGLWAQEGKKAGIRHLIFLVLVFLLAEQMCRNSANITCINVAHTRIQGRTLNRSVHYSTIMGKLRTQFVPQGYRTLFSVHFI